MEAPERKIRNRIPLQKNKGTIVIDDEAYIKNLGTDNARKIGSSHITIKYDKWVDKHYSTRYTIGDDDGAKRLGIEPEIIEEIVNDVFPYLFFFSGKIRGFAFIANDVDKNKAVINKVTTDCVINVVIETHCFDKDHFEVTVKTADSREDFRIADGQYFIEINDGFFSLKQRVSGKNKEILSI